MLTRFNFRMTIRSLMVLIALTALAIWASSRMLVNTDVMCGMDSDYVPPRVAPILDLAKALAPRAIASGTNDRERIDWLYQTVFRRSPTSEEAAFGLRSVSPTPPTVLDSDLWLKYCQVLLGSSEFLYLD